MDDENECEDCGAKIPDGDLVCMDCEEEREDEIAREAEEEADDELDEDEFCDECGDAVDAGELNGDGICSECEIALDDEDEDE